MNVNGIELDVPRLGSGAPIVVLHGFQTLNPDGAFSRGLAAHGTVFAPSLPGFGASKRPADCDTIFDLVHVVRGLLDSIGPATLVGLSFGGWIAAEVAAAGHPALTRLVLADPVGIRLHDRDTPDIFDIFNRSPADTVAASWHDPANAPDFDAMEDADIVTYARNRDALCLYAWEPYLHNPRLKAWLPRIAVPTLVLWGESDGIVSPEYGRAFAGLIPGARFETIPAAGHHPEIEQPSATVARIAHG